MLQDLEDRYRAVTARSRAMMAEAAHFMPGGSTRHFGFHAPYPPVFAGGKGARIRDVDGNEYVDLVCNGMSLVHGHAFAPAVEAIAAEVRNGWAWPGASAAQIAFADALAKRFGDGSLVRFTNSGTEAAMLAAKVARRVTGRPLILKALQAYHGSYDDFEAGLWGRGEIPGRTILATFNDIGSFAEALRTHPDQVAAVIIEPVMVTGGIGLAPASFFRELQELAHAHGALLIVDDCLMFRLAPGGSAQFFGFEPDITVLGKFIGGGIPVGAVVGSSAVMGDLDPLGGTIHHGGSFNGNVLGSVAGKATLDALTAEAIDRMAEQAKQVATSLAGTVAMLDLPVQIERCGSVVGMGFRDRDDLPGQAARQRFHLACLLNGVYIGTGGTPMVMCTALTDDDIGLAIEGLRSAMREAFQA